MRLIISVLLFINIYACSLILFSCDGNSTSKLSGNLQGTRSKTVYLERVEPIRTRLLDSASLNSNGNFSFKVEIPSNEPYFLSLRTDSLHLGTLLVDKGEKVSFSYANGKYEVEGSNGSALLKELSNMNGRYARSRDSIVGTLSPDNENLADVNRQLVKLLTKQKQDHIRFIVSNPKSFASIMAIYQVFSPDLPLFGRTEDLPYYQLLIDSLQTKYMASPFLEQLKTDSKNLKNQIELQAKLEKITIVDDFPDLSLPDKSGKEVKLSSLKGKTILLYFWSTAMQGNQLDNRELLNLYDKYHSKGLEIYQVSLDAERTKWIKAIEIQELPWINVCDGKGQASPAISVYNVTSLPHTFVIAKNGDIVGRNLFGDALEKKLSELLR